MSAARKYTTSFSEGVNTEQEFIDLLGDTFVRKATRSEDMTEHWDVLDDTFGKVDVKAPKRKYRGGPIDYSIHWWEFKNVLGRRGWGEPNGTDRLIAFRLEDCFALVDPSTVNDLLLEKCTEHYRGLWGLNTRKGRQDLAAMIPSSFLKENATHVLPV